MERLDPKVDGRSLNLVAENVEALRTIFPEAFVEDKVDFDVLRQLLGDQVDDRSERYGLNWAGKSRARQIAQIPSSGTLRPVPEESVDWDTTKNIFIEGDNLEVLKLLQKSYHRKVKMIYIDPPYNTGNEFIYPDKYQDNLDTYLRYTGQVDGEGLKISANTETQGRYHTNWLNMMYPRLKLARNLLREDGVLFVSIDRHELHNLLHVLDEIFGPENFVDVFTWVRTATPAALAAKSKKVVEYVVCYERAKNSMAYKGIEKPIQSSNPLLNQPNKEAELIFPPGVIDTKIPDCVLEAGEYGTERYRVTLLADATIRDGKFVSAVRMRAKFRWTQEYLESQLSDGVRVLIATNKLIPSYEKDSYGREAPPNLIDRKVGVGTNENATTELRELLPELSDDLLGRVHPKPVSLIKYLIDAVCQPEDLIIDFFAGSGTAGEAVLSLNEDDGGRRRYILVQLPELVDDLTFTSISDICIARLNAVGKTVNCDDSGYRYFRLSGTNVVPWESSPEDLDANLLASIQNIKADRTDADILFELLLKFGLDLALPADNRSIAGKRVDILGAGALAVCLESDVTLETVEGIGALKRELEPEVMRVVFRDTSFKDDVVKTNALQILKRAGIDDIKIL